MDEALIDAWNMWEQGVPASELREKLHYERKSKADESFLEAFDEALDQNPKSNDVSDVFNRFFAVHQCRLVARGKNPVRYHPDPPRLETCVPTNLGDRVERVSLRGDRIISTLVHGRVYGLALFPTRPYQAKSELNNKGIRLLGQPYCAGADALEKKLRRFGVHMDIDNLVRDIRPAIQGLLHEMNGSLRLPGYATLGVLEQFVQEALDKDLKDLMKILTMKVINPSVALEVPYKFECHGSLILRKIQDKLHRPESCATLQDAMKLRMVQGFVPSIILQEKVSQWLGEHVKTSSMEKAVERLREKDDDGWAVRGWRPYGRAGKENRESLIHVPFRP